MLHWIDCGIVYRYSHRSSSSCIGLIMTVFICVLLIFPHVALYWLWHCLSLFIWFFLKLHWIDCEIVYLFSNGSSSFLLDWLWHCLSQFPWFLLMLHLIDCDIVLPVFSWVFLMLPYIDCDIVYLCSYCSSSCCIGLIVTLFICALMVLSHVALDFDIVCLCSHGSSSCCIGLIVALFVCVRMALPRVALDCYIVYLCSYCSYSCCLGLIVTLFNGSPSCCIGLIVTLFISVLMVLPHVALDRLWHCLSVFSWLFVMLHWINCGITWYFIWTVTPNVRQCGSLTSVDSDEPVQAPFMLKNSKWCQ